MIDLKKNLPSILKITDVWPDFMDAITTELTYLQTEMEIKSNYLNIDEYTDKDELISLARGLGYTVNLLVDTSLSFVKSEVNDIVFRIKNKSIYYYYDYVFRHIGNEGETYILYKDYLRLVRAIDMSSVFTYLDSHTLTEPFTNLTPILHYDEVIDDPVSLDSEKVETIDTGWYLDQSTVIQPTNHLAIEYEAYQLYTNNGTEYIMYGDYFSYLRASSEYGKKLVNVPHIGVQLSCITDISGFYNNIDPTKSYSIPDLKLKCVTSPFYDITDDALDQMKTIKVGNGTRSLLDANYSSISVNQDIHYSFEHIINDLVDDLSNNDNNAVVNGNYTEITGASGNTISWNGVDTEVYLANYALSQGDKTICFWLKGNDLGQLYTTPWILFKSGDLSFYYNNIEQKLYFTLIGSITSSTVTYNVNLTNKEIFICLAINDTSGIMNLYIDNVLEDFDIISGIGTWGSTSNMYMGSKDNASFFRGYLDEFRFYNKILTSSERDYLYTQKAGNIVNLSSSYYSQSISTNQVEENVNWIVTYAPIPAKTVNNIVIGVGDGITNSFSGSFSHTDIEPGFLTISYFKFPTTYTLTVDSQGNIIGDYASGTVDFTNGTYDFYTSKEITVSEETLAEDSVSSFTNYTIGHSDITPLSFYLVFYISSTQYVATADSNGTITGTGISSGTIDYTTGVLNVTFTNPTDADTDVFCRYQYTVYSTPTLNYDITATYKTNEDLQITEVGIFDTDDRIMAYATFPPISFNSVHDHASFQFLISKSES